MFLVCWNLNDTFSYSMINEKEVRFECKNVIFDYNRGVGTCVQNHVAFASAYDARNHHHSRAFSRRPGYYKFIKMPFWGADWFTAFYLSTNGRFLIETMSHIVFIYLIIDSDTYCYEGSCL